MRKQYKRYLFLFFSLAALLIGLSGTGVAFAQGQTRLASPQKAAAQTCGSWSVVSSPNIGSFGSTLNGVSVDSASDAWAVGYYATSTVNQTLIEHWNGTSWSVVSSPNVGLSSNFLTSVTAVSPSDVWAVGYYERGSGKYAETLTEHWDGTSWSVVSSPSVGMSYNVLTSVTAVSTSDIWAVGYYNGSRTLIMNWDGTSWSLMHSPNGTSNNHLTGVAAASESSVWAVGYYNNSKGQQGTLTTNWNGTSWNVVPSPNVLHFNFLNSVAAVSTTDIWAVGLYSGNSEGTLIINWNGTSWSRVPSPTVGSDVLNGVAANSASEVWAVGYSGNPADLTSQTFIEQWNGTSWSVVSSPNPGSNDGLSGVSADSAGDVWAVGSYSTGTSGATLIEYYC